jgi:hypothetical protein
MKRKTFSFIFFLLIICAGIGMFFAKDINVLSLIFASFIRIFNCIIMGILALFVEELFPTTVRSLGVGI